VLTGIQVFLYVGEARDMTRIRRADFAGGVFGHALLSDPRTVGTPVSEIRNPGSGWDRVQSDGFELREWRVSSGRRV
jgi:hypothetical protein